MGGLDSEIVEDTTVTAIARFVKLLKDIEPGAQVVSALTDEYAYHYPEVKLTFNKAYASNKNTYSNTVKLKENSRKISIGIYQYLFHAFAQTKSIYMNNERR